MITISLRFEEDMKKQLDDMCDEMGMNLTTFFMIYAKKVLRDRRIPFDIVAPNAYLDERSDDTDSDVELTGNHKLGAGPPGRIKSEQNERLAKQKSKAKSSGRKS